MKFGIDKDGDMFFIMEEGDNWDDILSEEKPESKDENKKDASKK